jgi:hypothetical protein
MASLKLAIEFFSRNGAARTYNNAGPAGPFGAGFVEPQHRIPATLSVKEGRLIGPVFESR